jgi:hypothetical protein
MSDDIPIVNVPISGGVQYGAVSGGLQDVDTGSPPSAWGSNWQWFDPIALFCQLNPDLPTECQEWCTACSGQLVPQLVNMNTLPGSPIDYPQFTPANIQQYGLCQVFWTWMWSLFVSQNTGVPENPPVAGGGGTDGGGGG